MRAMAQIKISKPTQRDLNLLKRGFVDQWGAEYVVVRGRRLIPLECSILVAKIDNELVGVLTYQIENDECEIVTLQSLRENIGTGTKLIAELIRIARQNQCKRVRVITTNDNLRALRFYQRRGFFLTQVYPGAMEQSRRMKQEIPLQGGNGIPIRDEIELEFPL